MKKVRLQNIFKNFCKYQRLSFVCKCSHDNKPSPMKSCRIKRVTLIFSILSYNFPDTVLYIYKDRNKHRFEYVFYQRDLLPKEWMLIGWEEKLNAFNTNFHLKWLRKGKYMSTVEMQICYFSSRLKQMKEKILFHSLFFFYCVVHPAQDPGATRGRELKYVAVYEADMWGR